MIRMRSEVSVGLGFSFFFEASVTIRMRYDGNLVSARHICGNEECSCHACQTLTLTLNLTLTSYDHRCRGHLVVGLGGECYDQDEE